MPTAEASEPLTLSWLNNAVEGPQGLTSMIQRGVGRTGFSGISDREIARIECGEVLQPRGATLRVIADTLGVQPADIEAY